MSGPYQIPNNESRPYTFLVLEHETGIQVGTENGMNIFSHLITSLKYIRASLYGRYNLKTDTSLTADTYRGTDSTKVIKPIHS